MTMADIKYVVPDEVKRICEAQMKGIFFYPM